MGSITKQLAGSLRGWPRLMVTHGVCVQNCYKWDSSVSLLFKELPWNWCFTNFMFDSDWTFTGDASAHKSDSQKEEYWCLKHPISFLARKQANTCLLVLHFSWKMKLMVQLHWLENTLGWIPKKYVPAQSTHHPGTASASTCCIN